MRAAAAWNAAEVAEWPSGTTPETRRRAVGGRSNAASEVLHRYREHLLADVYGEEERGGPAFSRAEEVDGDNHGREREATWAVPRSVIRCSPRGLR